MWPLSPSVVISVSKSLENGDRDNAAHELRPEFLVHSGADPVRIPAVEGIAGIDRGFPQPRLPVGEHRIVFWSGGDGNFDQRIVFSPGQVIAIQRRQRAGREFPSPDRCWWRPANGNAMRIFLNDAALHDGRFLDEDLRQRGEISLERPVRFSAGSLWPDLANASRDVAGLVWIDRDRRDADFVVDQSLDRILGRHLRIVIGDDDDVLGSGVGGDQARIAVPAIQGEADRIDRSWAYRPVPNF